MEMEYLLEIYLDIKTIEETTLEDLLEIWHIVKTVDKVT